MFFSTPHFGLANKPNVWAKFAEHVLRHNPPIHAKGALPTQNMLDEIGLNSLELYNITEEFKPIQNELAFVTFVESEAMEGLEADEVVSTLFITAMQLTLSASGILPLTQAHGALWNVVC